MKNLLIFILTFSSTLCGTYANENLQEYLKDKCNKHELALEYSHWKDNENNWERCYRIGSAQLVFETKWCTIWAWELYNNCFWFKRKSFIEFNTKEESIDFYVDHYYKYQRYKTIKQITMDSYYCSPITWWCGQIKGFSYTIEHQKSYYTFVKDYFNNNKENDWTD